MRLSSASLRILYFFRMEPEGTTHLTFSGLAKSSPLLGDAAAGWLEPQTLRLWATTAMTWHVPGFAVEEIFLIRRGSYS